MTSPAAGQRRTRPWWLLVVALFGLTVPNGVFLYWMAREYHGLAGVFADRLALGFILDAFMTMLLLAERPWVARAPRGGSLEGHQAVV